MTNSKIVLGVSLAAILAVGMVSAPIWADPITELVKTKVKYDDDEYDKIKFKLANKVPKDGSVFGGYAIFTSGHVIAVTSHPGFYDSETQSEPTLTPSVQFDGPAAACATGDTGCGAEWHTHMVEPVKSEYCGLAAVGALTFEEVSDELKVKSKKLVLKEIESDDFTDALSGEEKDFVAGTPVDLEDALLAFAGLNIPQDGTFTGVAFDLNPAIVGGELKAVCIGDVAAPTVPPGGI